MPNLRRHGEDPRTGYSGTIGPQFLPGKGPIVPEYPEFLRTSEKRYGGRVRHDRPMRFTGELQSHGGTTTGFVVPEEIVEGLGGGRRPKVTVTVNGHTWRSSIASMGGQMLLGVSKDNREAAGVHAGEVLDVEVELDTAPRTVDVPPLLAEALAADPGAKAAWDALSYSHQRAHAEPIAATKNEETRQRRVDKTMSILREGTK